MIGRAWSELPADIRFYVDPVHWTGMDADQRQEWVDYSRSTAGWSGHTGTQLRPEECVVMTGWVLVDSIPYHRVAKWEHGIGDQLTTRINAGGLPVGRIGWPGRWVPSSITPYQVRYEDRRAIQVFELEGDSEWLVITVPGRGQLLFQQWR